MTSWGLILRVRPGVQHGYESFKLTEKPPLLRRDLVDGPVPTYGSRCSGTSIALIPWSVRAQPLGLPASPCASLQAAALGEAGPERPAISLRSQHLQDGFADAGGLVVDDLLPHVRRGLVEGEAAATARILRSITRR
jgi:hypothetical protein